MRFSNLIVSTNMLVLVLAGGLLGCDKKQKSTTSDSKKPSAGKEHSNDQQESAEEKGTTKTENSEGGAITCQKLEDHFAEIGGEKSGEEPEARRENWAKWCKKTGNLKKFPDTAECILNADQLEKANSCDGFKDLVGAWMVTKAGAQN